MTEMKDVTALEALIKDAFDGVTLGDGISLSQSVVIDNDGCDSGGRELTRLEFDQLREKDLTDNWQLLTLTVDEVAFGFAFMDAAGFRYYLPACMIYALQGHAVAETIGHLSSGHRPTRVSEHQTALLNGQQKHAIAQFLYWLPYNLNLGDEMRSINNLIARGLRSYWGRYLNLEAED